MTRRFLSVCSGIEAASTAWMPLGWHPVAFSEIEPFPCAVLAHHYPDVPNWGDMTKFKEWPDADVDLLCGGTPCFAGHTLIATKRGLIPISRISVGDEVLTHLGRWRKVLATGNKIAATMMLCGQGHSDGIETTAGHPFYSRNKRRVWVGRESGSWASEMSAPEWVEAKEMVGKFWASPAVWPEDQAPAIKTQGREHEAPAITPELMRVIGRWLGDGWCRINDRRGYVLICCNKKEGAAVERELCNAGLHFSLSEERTTLRFQVANRALARWLVTHFGSGARGKTMPTWLFCLAKDFRLSFFDGYLSADGCKTVNGHRASTVSPGIALGMVLLAHTLGLSASRRFVRPKREIAVIEGRAVDDRGFFQLTFYDRSRSSVADGAHRWGLVRKSAFGRETTVFNLEIEEDNSYVADGIVVHNCQSFSVAGLRKGLDDPRGNLMLTYLAIADKYRPRWLVWENVPGVLSSDGGRDFGTLLGGLAELGYGFAYRVLDAQYVRVQSHPRAVPQRRRRVFVVGYLGDWQRAAAVLFERESLRGHPAPRRTAGQSVAGTISARTQGGGGLGTDFELGGGLVSHALRGEGFDASEDGTGRGTPLITAIVGQAMSSKWAKGTAGPAGDEHHNLIPVPFDTTQITPASSYSAHAPCIAFPARLSATQHASSEDVSPALGALNPTAIAMQERAGADPGSGPGGKGWRDDGAAYTLEARHHVQSVAAGWAVRRLTPLECERLQGFPDGHTAVLHNGKPAADGPRYKALGNSWAINCARWIGERIDAVDRIVGERE